MNVYDSSEHLTSLEWLEVYPCYLENNLECILNEMVLIGQVVHLQEFTKVTRCIIVYSVVLSEPQG